MNNKPAFTLIEILVASTIIIVLMSIGVASFRVAAQSSRDAKRKADMETIRQALVLRRSALGNYGVASDFATIGTNIDTYLSGPLPSDPGSNTYTGRSDNSSFCLCSRLESGKGNAAVAGATTPTSTACGGVTWNALGTGTAYCVDQP